MAFEKPRKITDARAMRALAHPVRLALLEALSVEGTLTATQAAEKVGESPSSCSFHLRQLAKYGFVEEAGGGAGRERPWRRLHQGFSMERVHPDPETNLAAALLEHTAVEGYLRNLREWMATSASYPADWQNAAWTTETLLYVTPEELRTLGEEVNALIDRYRDRVADRTKRPPRSRPVEALLFSYPKRV